MVRHILVAVAWPYASGSRHLGHLAGAYLPADIFARFHRLSGNRTLMVSGSDVHGTPITVRADGEGVHPQVIVDRYHHEFVNGWKALAIQWELYTSTGTANHHEVTQDIFRRLHENGFIDRRTSWQFYDPALDRFLPDRYVEGICPHCAYLYARGDQCDKCGRTLDPVDLIKAISKLSGEQPVQRETDHFYLRLSDFSERLEEWLRSRQGWRKHVLNFSLGWIEEGLQDRAITRDIDWGIDIPVEGLGEGKKIYVWFDAVIGYLSASKEWAKIQRQDEAWKDWWENPDAEHVYFIGKDNIPFHTIIWPAMLLGYGGLELPTNVPANQYVTFRGGKASASRGIGLTIKGALCRYEPDALRYALAANLPENSDTEVSEEELGRRINDELIATWGNLVNRVLSLTRANFDSQVPERGEQSTEGADLLAATGQTLDQVAAHIERVELRAGLRTAMAGAARINAYLNATEPWKLVKTDPAQAATVLKNALDAINHLKVAFSPYLPVTSERLHSMIGLPGRLSDRGWEGAEVPAGTQLGEIAPLYRKVDTSTLSNERVTD
ncbi:MAG: methionine--tRNA ligase [bacterium]|nr:methionine--tRNA ligase [bacterium]MCY3579348.1 methionine--tRNA ligase [bacterium]MDE0644105.1 methionine--tRNA ligase [bacterium]MYH55401.1 methionine--tRNA ligase [Acidimicrobiia bacterium]